MCQRGVAPAFDVAHATTSATTSVVAAMTRRVVAGGDRIDASRRLQRFGRVIGEPRALATRQRDVSRTLPALHAVDDIGEPRASLGEIRRVDLRDVAEADDLGT